MLMFSLLKTLQGGEPLVVELKNDCRVRGTLVSVDQSVFSLLIKSSSSHFSRIMLMFAESVVKVLEHQAG